MTALAEWGNFYVIVGSTAGALTGLQFVAITLIADLPSSNDNTQAGEAFATPTIVHFGSVVLLAAILAAPWQASRAPTAVCGLLGICGLLYTALVLRAMRTQKAYEPVAEDWIFHSCLPLLAYASLTVAAAVAVAHLRASRFQIAGSALLLLVTGLHNAWDNVLYLAFARRPRPKEQDQASSHPPASGG